MTTTARTRRRFDREKQKSLTPANKGTSGPRLKAFDFCFLKTGLSESKNARASKQGEEELKRRPPPLLFGFFLSLDYEFGVDRP